MRILVTGGAGYIGSHAVRHFLAQGHDVWVYDNLSMGHRKAVPEGRLLVGDLNESARVDHALLSNRIEAVVHFAAHLDVGESVREPGKYYQNNVVNTLNLLEHAAERHQAFCLSSTAATFGVPDKMPITRSTPGPINPYGRSKLVIERPWPNMLAYEFSFACYAIQCRRSQQRCIHRGRSPSRNPPDPSSFRPSRASGSIDITALTIRRRTAPAFATCPCGRSGHRPCSRSRILSPGKGLHFNLRRDTATACAKSSRRRNHSWKKAPVRETRGGPGDLPCS